MPDNIFMSQLDLKDTAVLDAVGYCSGLFGYTTLGVPGFHTKVPVPPIVFFWKTQPRPPAGSRQQMTRIESWHHTVGRDMTRGGENERKREKECCNLALFGIFKLQTLVVSVEAWHP